MAQCVYCGEEAEKTLDHVVPSCLFSSRPGNPVKVLTCGCCNNKAKSQLDSYFRDRLMLDALAQQHPTVRKIRAEQFARAKEGGHSKLSRTYSATAVDQDVFVGTTYVGRYQLFQPVNSRIEEEIRYITKGLSFDRSDRRVRTTMRSTYLAWQDSTLQIRSRPCGTWRYGNLPIDSANWMSLSLCIVAPKAVSTLRRGASFSTRR
jgi:hypothetical protein